VFNNNLWSGLASQEVTDWPPPTRLGGLCRFLQTTHFNPPPRRGSCVPALQRTFWGRVAMFAFLHLPYLDLFTIFCVSLGLPDTVSFKIPLWCMEQSDTGPTNDINRRASSKQSPQMRPCHECDRSVQALCQVNRTLWKVFFQTQFSSHSRLQKSARRRLSLLSSLEH